MGRTEQKSLERQAENAERVVDEKSEEAHEWAPYARDMQKQGVSGQAISKSK